jgi:hypothetical protein
VPPEIPVQKVQVDVGQQGRSHAPYTME